MTASFFSRPRPMRSSALKISWRTQTLDDPSKINANLWNRISEHLWTRWHLYIFLFVDFQPTLHYAWPSSKQNLWPVSARSRLTTKHLNTRPSAQKSNGPTQSRTFGLALHKFKNTSEYSLESWDVLGIQKPSSKLPSIISIHLSFGFSRRHDGTLIQQVGQVCTSTGSSISSKCYWSWCIERMQWLHHDKGKNWSLSWYFLSSCFLGAPPSSFCSTAKHQCAAASRPIPSLSLLRPAPDMPGVWRATASKSTPGAKFLPLAWTFRISYRPWTSGGSTSLRNLTSRD